MGKDTPPLCSVVRQRWATLLLLTNSGNTICIDLRLKGENWESRRRRRCSSHPSHPHGFWRGEITERKLLPHWLYSLRALLATFASLVLNRRRSRTRTPVPTSTRFRYHQRSRLQRVLVVSIIYRTFELTFHYFLDRIFGFGIK